jgi:DNA-directed RNA polymerase subunit F
MCRLRLIKGTKGLFSAAGYEISKELNPEPGLEHLGSILAKEDSGIDEEMLNKIIELSEK